MGRERNDEENDIWERERELEREREKIGIYIKFMEHNIERIENS